MFRSYTVHDLNQECSLFLMAQFYFYFYLFLFFFSELGNGPREMGRGLVMFLVISSDFIFFFLKGPNRVEIKISPPPMTSFLEIGNFSGRVQKEVTAKLRA